MTQSDLVVFSHLRWDFVWQRPQHLLSRLAASRRVFFIEEPIHVAEGANRWKIHRPFPNLAVCQFRSSEPEPGFTDRQLQHLKAAMPALIRDEHITDSVAWFYTPMALPLLDPGVHSLVVYDCMDELSAFRNAPPQILKREAELLRAADLVFTGGPSLFRAKKDRHAHVHCFPSSVDVQHFAKARKAIAEAADQAAVPHPRFGFFGVIDERFDVELIDRLATARPSWQFCLVGPVVKIDPSILPRHPNVHYFGQRSYAELPGFLAGWDVCLLPFARNESTKFISPTKTLEYMAAGRPIVSTPITDVAEPYGDIVYLGDTAASFESACAAALSASPSERQVRHVRVQGILARTSWDGTAKAMSSLMEQARVEKKENAARARHQKRAAAPAPRPTSPEPTPPVLVIGAGPTGLSAAYHLGQDALLIERNPTIGGWCRSIVENGFTFDFAGHIMFSNDAYVHEMYSKLLGENVHWQEREAWIYSKNVYTRYPFQGALYGLPAQVIKECILGAIEARYGSVKAEPASNGNGHASNGNGSAASLRNGTNGSNGHGSNGHHDLRNGAASANGGTCVPGNGSVSDCCADGVLESTARLSAAGPKAAGPRNFEEFIYKVWGTGIAKHFAIPYNRKLWAVPLTEMETSWLGGRVPLPDLEEMIDGALSPVGKPMGPNARFGYPLRGGFQALMDGFLPHLRGPLLLNTAVTRVSPSRRVVALADGRELPYEQLISTMPLPVLIRQLGDEAPREIQQAAKALRYISVRCVHLGIGREKLTDKHWIYYPEDSIFHRIFVQGNASPYCNAPGGFGLTCEITYHPQYKPLPCDGEVLIGRCIEDCRKVGFIDKKDPIWAATQVDLPHAYVVYDHDRARNVKVIRDWLLERDILLSGRYSEWEYYNSDHAFLAGKKAAEHAQQRRHAGSAVRV